jgi:hypothetical protein
MGNNINGASANTLKKHIETATKTGVLQYDNKKLKEVEHRSISNHMCLFVRWLNLLHISIRYTRICVCLVCVLYR